MSCRIESVGSDLWRFCPEIQARPGQRLRAVVRARVLDEIDGQPIRSVRVSTPDSELASALIPRVSGDALVGLAGHPGRLFPDLASTPVSIPLRIEARGYLPLDLPGTLGPQPGFPDLFVPLDHGEIGLHRIGVALRGRVVERQNPLNLALPGAQIAISGVWSAFPPPGVSPALLMEPPDLAALVPGLYADWAAATLEGCTLVLDAAQAKSLLLPVVPGDRRLRLTNRASLAPGQPLLLDPDDPGRRELIGIRAIDTALSDDQPAWVELHYPVKHLHRSAVPALPTVIPATQGPRALARPARTGDPLAFLSAAAPWAPASPMRVGDGLAPPEYQWTDQFATAADGDGYFRLPRISRVALIQIEASHPSQPAPLLLVLEPDYGLAEQSIQVAFE